MIRLLVVLAVTVPVVPALVVTAARLAPDGGLLWVILRALTPLAIVPYAAAALVLALALWRWHGLAGWASTTALVVVTSLLVLHVWWFATPFLASAEGEPTDDALSVMTINLHIGRADADAVLAEVDRRRVDLLVLVEVTPTSLDALDRAGLADRLPQRAGTTDLGRDGTMVLSSQPLREIGPIPLASPGVEAEMATDRGPVRVLAVHPTAPNNGVARWSSDLEAMVTAARDSTGPTVVAGDFNATLDHPRIRDLTGSDFRDAGADAGLGWGPTWPSKGDASVFGRGLPPLFALDHVFVHGPLAATRAETRTVPGTDHRALVTRIAWTRSG